MLLTTGTPVMATGGFGAPCINNCILSYYYNMSTQQFWSITDEYPDLVTRLHMQAKLMGNFGPQCICPLTKGY